MSIAAAYMVPHPPMIVPQVGRGSENQVLKTIQAYEAVASEIAEIKPRSIYKLDDNFAEAFKMAERMKKIEKALPGVNCSACGAPSCAALAEDIVRGEAKVDTCIFINRHSQASEDAIRRIWGDRVKTKEINNNNNTNDK